jgi:Zn-dependent protease
MNIHIGDVILGMVAFLFSLTFHEFAHAWTSSRFGDDTGRYQGRISLDPRDHLELWGSIILPLIGFLTGGYMIGWAKPVEVNPNRWKNKVLANIVVSGAGPFSNILLALLSILVLKVFLLAGTVNILQLQSLFQSGQWTGNSDLLFGLIEPIFRLLRMMILINILLAVFNMLPIPPLDGSHILSSLLSVTNPKLMNAYEEIRPYGFMILLVTGLTGILGFILTPMMSGVFRALAAIL